MYQGNSVVDYLKSTGQKTDYASRAALAASKGITNFSGTAEQNTQLLNILRGGSTPTQTQQAPQAQATPTVPQSVATPATQSTTQPQGTSGQPGSAQDLVSMGYYGYQGWGNAEAIADYKATGGQGKGGSQAGGGAGAGTGTFFNQPTIDLPALYDSLYQNSGITQIETEVATKTKAYNEQVAKIKDNPYLSEATMTGRLSKLESKFNADTQALRDQVATRKADIETRLNLTTKQFDIQSEQAQMALSQFNSLLEAGALDSANGEDIANITRSTGISSNLIYSAIDSRKQSQLATEIKSFDDGFEEGFVVYTLDPMGNIVNQTRQVTGKSVKSSQYSADPTVSGFIESYLKQQTGEISDIWNEAGQGY